MNTTKITKTMNTTKTTNTTEIYVKFWFRKPRTWFRKPKTQNILKLADNFPKC